MGEEIGGRNQINHSPERSMDTKLSCERTDGFVQIRDRDIYVCEEKFFLMLSIWGMFMNKVSLHYNFRVITLIN